MGIGDLPSYRERKRKRKRLKDKYSFRKKTKKQWKTVARQACAEFHFNLMSFRTCNSSCWAGIYCIKTQETIECFSIIFMCGKSEWASVGGSSDGILLKTFTSLFLRRIQQKCYLLKRKNSILFTGGVSSELA